MLESQLEEWLAQMWEVEQLAVSLEPLWEEALLGVALDTSLEVLSVESLAELLAQSLAELLAQSSLAHSSALPS